MQWWWDEWLTWTWFNIKYSYYEMKICDVLLRHNSEFYLHWNFLVVNGNFVTKKWSLHWINCELFYFLQSNLDQVMSLTSFILTFEPNSNFLSAVVYYIFGLFSFENTVKMNFVKRNWLILSLMSNKILLNTENLRLNQFTNL